MNDGGRTKRGRRIYYLCPEENSSFDWSSANTNPMNVSQSEYFTLDSDGNKKLQNQVAQLRINKLRILTANRLRENVSRTSLFVVENDDNYLPIILIKILSSTYDFINAKILMDFMAQPPRDGLTNLGVVTHIETYVKTKTILSLLLFTYSENGASLFCKSKTRHLSKGVNTSKFKDCREYQYQHTLANAVIPLGWMYEDNVSRTVLFLLIHFVYLLLFVVVV